MSEQPFHETERFNDLYRKCVDDINSAWYHYITVSDALKGHPQFTVIDTMLKLGYEATRAKLQAAFLEDVWSTYYDIYERPKALAESAAYEAAHPERSWDYHPMNPNAKKWEDKAE